MLGKKGCNVVDLAFQLVCSELVVLSEKASFLP